MFKSKKNVVAPEEIEDEASLETLIQSSNDRSASSFIERMPDGHENFSMDDVAKCPVMSQKIQNQSNQNEEDDSSSSDSDEDGESQIEMPRGHENYSEADKDKCPVMSFKKNDGNESQNGKKKKIKKPKGGCPFMPTENKKNPALEQYEESYEVPYISPIRHFFTSKTAGNGSKRSPSKQFDSLPIFVKHTLFHDESKFGKIRQLEVSQRFFICDNMREQGNKRYHKKKFEDALQYYEYAVSCFKWLEFKESSNEYDEESKEEKKEDPFAKLKPLNRAMVTALSDDNVILHDGNDISDPNELDMRNATVLNICISIACCYMRMSNYRNALDAINEAFKITDTSSQLHFRRSQAVAFNKCSSYNDLLNAKADIEKAIEIKKTEKIFKVDQNVLKIMNIHNAEEVYQEHLEMVEKKIQARREYEKNTISDMFNEVKELEFIEREMSKEGKNLIDKAPIDMEEEENMEYELAKELCAKYLKIIEFNVETGNKEQMKMAKEEMMTAVEVYSKMKYFVNLDFKNHMENSIILECLNEININLTNPKTLKRLDKIKVRKSKELFDGAHFNMKVLQYAMSDYMNKRDLKEKKEKERREEAEENQPIKYKWIPNLTRIQTRYQILFVILLIAIILFSRDHGSLPKFFSKS